MPVRTVTCRCGKCDHPDFEVDGMWVMGIYELADVLVVLQARGQDPHVNEDDGFASSNYIGLMHRRDVAEEVQRQGGDPDKLTCLKNWRNPYG